MAIFRFIFILSIAIGLSSSSVFCIPNYNNNVCTILSEKVEVKVNSLKDVDYFLERKMIFHNEHSQLQNFYLPYDSDTKIKNVKIKIYKKDKLVKEYNKKDLSDHSAISSYSLYEDSRYLYADLALDDYPYQVDLSYELQQKELVVIDPWLPQKFNSKVESALFTLIHPASIPINYKAINSEFQFTEEEFEGKSLKRWKLKELSPVKKERYMPNEKDILPTLMCIPEKFIYGGYEGSFKDWESYSNYLWKLNNDRDELSEEQKKTVDKICSGLSSNKEKINGLYNWLQENTRYVSVQLGIGGWQTFDAAYVERNKFGDCKALSNFMKAMLKHAGIESNMIIIGSGKDSYPLKEDFVAPFMNHAILYIPEEDIWLECTSSFGPSAYVGSSIEDRNCLLVSERNGGLLKTPSLENSSCVRQQRIIIDEEGSAEGHMICVESGEYQESNRFFINTEKKSDLEEKFIEEFGIKGLEVLKFECTVDSDSPTVTRSFDLRANKFASTTGSRIFVPVSLIEHNFYLLSAKERSHDILFKYEINENDEVSISIPIGYEIESMPNPNLEIDTQYGKYIFHISVDGTQINIQRTLVVHKGRYPVSEYDQIKEFMSQVRKLANAKIVLKKKV